MEFTAQQIAGLIGASIEGNPDTMVNRLEKIEEATTGALAFLSNPKYTPYAFTTQASILIVSNDFKADKPLTPTLLRSADPRAAFAKLLEAYEKVRLNKSGISQYAFVAKTAKTGQNVYVGEFSYVGENAVLGDDVKIFPQVYVGDGVEIGAGSILYPGVKVYYDCKIGKNCIFHSGVIIGSDGFGYTQDEQHVYQKVPQTGNVVIGNDVEIGANSTVDRSTMGSTRIGNGVKLDNLVQVAHNSEIGDNTIFVSQSGIAGSSKIGSNCQVGGQVGIGGHITIADNVRIGGQSGVNASVKEPGSIIMGTPAMDFKTFQRSSVYFKKFEELVRRLEALEKKTAEK